MLNLTADHATGYEPVGIADNLDEAIEILAAHIKAFGDAETCRIWERGFGGRWVLAQTLTATEVLRRAEAL